MLGSADILLFEGFRLDRGGLFRVDQAGIAEPVALGSRALDLLTLLAGRCGELISKDEIMQSVWPRTVVEDNNLTVQISALRRLLDVGRADGSCIQTLPGRGYRFVAPVRWVATVDPATLWAPTTVADRPLLLVPDKPSVAVLPFINMSRNPVEEFLADGITEDITTALSRYPSLFVIARTSSFSYKGRAVGVKRIARELGIRYLVEGSLRKSNSRVRITARLIEGEGAKAVWAEQYYHSLADIFELQQEIAEAVTIAVAPSIAEAELRRALRKPPESLDVWGAYQRGLWHLGQFNAIDAMRAERFFERAIQLDETFAGGYSGLATARLHAAAGFQTRSISDAQQLAEILARRALALDAADADARACLAAMLKNRGDYEGAIAEAEHALAISPNLADAYAALGMTLTMSGRLQDGQVALGTSIRLDPRSPILALRLHQLVINLYFCRNYEAAIEAARNGIRSYPDFPLTHRWLAAALAQLDRTAEAKEVLAKAVAVAPASFDMHVRRRVPWMPPDQHAHMLDGLRKAGWKG